MSKPNIAQKGSYVVEVQEGKKYFWCACGLSQKQPFCDGSHKSTGFSLYSLYCRGDQKSLLLWMQT
jgi:CDGSH-type Zn-finger protein